jgi:hypothetical protein
MRADKVFGAKVHHGSGCASKNPDCQPLAGNTIITLRHCGLFPAETSRGICGRSFLQNYYYIFN